MDRRYDILVIGSGIAGLFYALRAAETDPKARIAIITKKRAEDTNTNRAQGGIAAVMSGTDSTDAHIADTLRTGCGLCHQPIVERVVRSGPEVIRELVDYGVRFTQRDGQFDLGREGGHSANRVVHADDLTGREIERALLHACRAKKDQITIFRDFIALDLITYTDGDRETCAGAFTFYEKERKFDTFYAPVT
ncbi:MAG: FAD-dependent oxidoreductase, partial [Candidatus Zixiibacteriota bacterium]